MPRRAKPKITRLDRQISEWARNRRLFLEVSQDVIATELGIGRATYSQFENGKHILRLSLVQTAVWLELLQSSFKDLPIPRSKYDSSSDRAEGR